MELPFYSFKLMTISSLGFQTSTRLVFMFHHLTYKPSKFECLFSPNVHIIHPYYHKRHWITHLKSSPYQTNNIITKKYHLHNPCNETAHLKLIQ